uniref:Uncharacterized protein n=1 Tax=Plectus sambesii TaxID=2011161 RepID=A0A914WP61_9BILA
MSRRPSHDGPTAIAAPDGRGGEGVVERRADAVGGGNANCACARVASRCRPIRRAKQTEGKENDSLSGVSSPLQAALVGLVQPLTDRKYDTYGAEQRR